MAGSTIISGDELVGLIRTLKSSLPSVPVIVTTPLIVGPAGAGAVAGSARQAMTTRAVGRTRFIRDWGQLIRRRQRCRWMRLTGRHERPELRAIPERLKQRLLPCCVRGLSVALDRLAQARKCSIGVALHRLQAGETEPDAGVLGPLGETVLEDLPRPYGLGRDQRRGAEAPFPAGGLEAGRAAEAEHRRPGLPGDGVTVGRGVRQPDVGPLGGVERLAVDREPGAALVDEVELLVAGRVVGVGLVMGLDDVLAGALGPVGVAAEGADVEMRAYGPPGEGAWAGNRLELVEMRYPVRARCQPCACAVASRRARPTCSAVTTPRSRPSPSTAMRAPKWRRLALPSRESSGASTLTCIAACSESSRSPTLELPRLTSGTSSARSRSRSPRNCSAASTTGNHG